MKLHGKRKLLGSVLGLSLVALVVDRQLLGPSQASAQLADAQQFAVDRDQPAVESMSPVAPEAALAGQLQTIAETESFDLAAVPDAFVPSGSWRPELETVAEAAEAGPSPAQRFAEAHRLTATMAGTASGFALIDGRTLFVGQSLDGFTLVEVAERSATFEADGARTVLTVEDEPGPTGRAGG